MHRKIKTIDIYVYKFLIINKIRRKMLKKYHNKYFIEKFLRPTLEEFNKNGKLNNKDGVLFTGIVGSAVIHQIYKESEHDESYDIKIREPAIRVS